MPALVSRRLSAARPPGRPRIRVDAGRVNRRSARFDQPGSSRDKGLSLNSSGSTSVLSSNTDNVHLDTGAQLILRVQ